MEIRIMRSRAAWEKIHPVVRQECLDDFERQMPPEDLIYWKLHYDIGAAVGVGPAIPMRAAENMRSFLRGKLINLPVHCPSLADDCTLGALQELLEREWTGARP